MKNEIDLDLVKVKRELFEFVLSISKEEDSLSFTLQYAKELWDWMASGPLSDDIQDAVRAVDHCVGELYQQLEQMNERVSALEPAAEVADVPLPAVGPKQAEPLTPKPTLEPSVTVAPKEAPPQVSVRSRFWDAIHDSGKDGMTYARAYELLGLTSSDQTVLSNYVSEWKAEGRVVVRADNHLNRKRFWLKEFAPTEPEPPLPPTQGERILFYLRDDAKDSGANHPKIADETGIPEGSCQTVLSKMLNAGIVEHDDGIGKKRFWFAKGLKPRKVMPPLPSQSQLKQCPCGNTFRPENPKQEACNACRTVETT